MQGFEFDDEEMQRLLEQEQAAQLGAPMEFAETEVAPPALGTNPRIVPTGGLRPELPALPALDSLPSGQVSPEEKARIGNDLALNRLAEVFAKRNQRDMAIANTYKLGGSVGNTDTSGVAKQFADQRAEMQQPIADARAERERAVEDYTLAGKARDRALNEQLQIGQEERAGESHNLGTQQKALEIEKVEQALRADSPYSQTAREAGAEALDVEADVLEQGNPALAEQFRTTAKRLRADTSISAQAADLIMERLGSAGELARKTMHDRATESLARANLRIDQARLDETKRQHDDTAERAEAKARTGQLKAQVKTPPEKTMRDMRETRTALRTVNRMRELLPKLRYLGWGADTLNQLASKSPKDFRTPEEREFASLLGAIRAKERKNIYGAALSKFDIADAETWLASLGTNEETIGQNLDTLGKGLSENYVGMVSDYAKLAGEDYNPGMSTQEAEALAMRLHEQQAAAARELMGKPPAGDSAVTPTAPAQPPAGTAPSPTVDPKLEAKLKLAEEARNDPNAPPEIKARAEELLRKHGR